MYGPRGVGVTRYRTLPERTTLAILIGRNAEKYSTVPHRFVTAMLTPRVQVPKSRVLGIWVLVVGVGIGGTLRLKPYDSVYRLGFL